MTREDIRQEVADIVEFVSDVKVDARTFSDEASLSKDLMFDSLIMIQYIVELEDKFDIAIDDLEDLDQFDCIGNTVDFVENYLSINEG